MAKIIQFSGFVQKLEAAASNKTAITMFMDSSFGNDRAVTVFVSRETGDLYKVGEKITLTISTEPEK